MDIPPMNWHGWFTIVLPAYFIVAGLIGWLLSTTSVEFLDWGVHVAIELVLMVLAMSISVFAYRRYDTWEKHIVVILLSLDVVFITNTSILFALVLR